ncbi:hypothetical protein Tco_0699610 [Tanacetum coccineum]
MMRVARKEKDQDPRSCGGSGTGRDEGSLERICEESDLSQIQRDGYDKGERRPDLGETMMKPRREEREEGREGDPDDGIRR